MPSAVLKDLATKQKAIEILASNPSQVNASKELNVSESTISRFKDKNRQEIEKQAEKYLAEIPSIVEHDIKQIRESQLLSDKLISHLKTGSKASINKAGETVELFPKDEVAALQKFIELTEKKVTDIKRSIGIYNSQTPSMIFQQMNIYNDNKAVISPEVLLALGTTIDNLTDNVGEDGDNEGILDAEYE